MTLNIQSISVTSKMLIACCGNVTCNIFMTRINFIKKRFSGRTAALLDKVTQVIAEYQNKGYSLTLRQLYYQLVSKNIVENLPREYKKLSRLLTDARMAGMVDWDAIEDRGRVSRIPAHFENLQEFAMAAANSYRLDRWKNQDYYIEVWVEKDALSGVIEPITRKYHVNLLVNRGYSSASAIFESAQRMTRQAYGIHKNCVILYLGDHDPSGEDMVRDIQERLYRFHVNVKVEKIALTRSQVEEYKLPPNPTKRSDTRSPRYRAEHGDKSWELDALGPEVLREILECSIKQYLNLKKYDKIVRKEEDEKQRLVQLCKSLT